MKPLSLALSLFCVTAVSAQRVSYDGYQVFRVQVRENVEKVNDIISRLGLTTWKGAKRAGAAADIVVPPGRIDDFTKEIEGLDVTIMHTDLGASISKESTFDIYAAGSANNTWFESYHGYDDHLQFLKDLQGQFSDNAEMVTSGKSLEGKPITGIHFYGSSGKGKKPAIVLHGTVHAREWIASMVVEYFAYTLLSNYSSSDEIKAFVDKYDFYVFPFVNPDGFVYTQTTDRMWRKNRQDNQGASCAGTDINRNWAYMWNVTGGASTDPCAEDFKGDKAGGAPETTALASWIKGIKDAQGLKLYIDYHSYGQLFMTPYGYTCSKFADNNDELQSLAQGASTEIEKVHGTKFVAGPICTTIYKATGSSVDYVNDVVKGDYTFTSELRDQGNYGFVLPPEQIVPSGEEAFAGFQYLLQNMK